MPGELPSEVLGYIGPILSWVDGADAMRLPESWQNHEVAFYERERAWLKGELPTHSYDSLDNIVKLARGPSDPQERPRKRPFFMQDKPGAGMQPPAGYELARSLGRLSERYLIWNGNELNVRGGRMEELHDLSLRFPVRHLIRFRHARSAAEGLLSQNQAMNLPEMMHLLHTDSQGMRAVVERGIAEGHLHLNGVLSADEAWADQALRRLSFRALEKLPSRSRNLLLLSRAATRMLGLGLIHWLIESEGSQLPFYLIELLDQVYFSPARESWELGKRLQRAFTREVRRCPGIESANSKALREHLPWLVWLVEPTAHHLFSRDLRAAGMPVPEEPTGVRQRLKLIEKLHFLIHLALIKVDAADEEAPPPEDAARGTRFRDEPEPDAAWPMRPEKPSEPARPRQSRPGPSKIATRRQWRAFLQDVFYRYLIYHTHFWQESTQSGRTTGLRNFEQHYHSQNRRLDAFGGDELEYRGLVLERLSQSQPLRTVEGRVTPPRFGVSELLPWTLGYLRASDKSELDKFGLVIHFVKNNPPVKRLAKAMRIHPRLRHDRTRGVTRRKAFNLFRLLSTPHPATPFIVGIDAASLELGAPPEVFAPAFRFLREFPIRVRASPVGGRCMESHDDVVSLIEDRRLGMTYHVGEDFCHLLSGLRAIHEVIEFLKPRRGDRLGHAIALGLNPRSWMRQIGYQAALSKQEWLDTLVWVYHLLGPGHDLVLAFELEDEIKQLSRQIYGHLEAEFGRHLDWTPATLYDAWRLRQLDPGSINLDDLLLSHRSAPSQGSTRWVDEYGRKADKWIYLRQERMRLRRENPFEFAEERYWFSKPDPRAPDDADERYRVTRKHSPDFLHRRWARVQVQAMQEATRRLGSNDSFYLLGHYWYDQNVKRNGDKVISVDMEGHKHEWTRLCREVQARVKKIIEREQIVVEVNPSCNRVVGPFNRYSEHHVFDLTLDEENRMLQDIRVTVNSDNPGVFNTSLMHEFYLLAEILFRKNVPEAQVITWLDWLRKNGNDYSFTRQLPDLGDPRMARVLDSLRKRNPALMARMDGRRLTFAERLARWPETPEERQCRTDAPDPL